MATNMNERNEDTIDVLNDLIRINHDRIAGYERAIKEAKDIDMDLKNVFNRMGEESTVYVSELSEAVTRLGGEPATDSTTSGKIYRAWMDVKATFTGHDRQSILASCEFGEDAAQKAYKAALESDDLHADARQLVTNQKSALKQSHDLIKRYRDMHDEVKK